MPADETTSASVAPLSSDPFGPAAVSARVRPASVETVCPVCGSRLHEEKCKVVCRSAACVYRIVFNCAEF